MDVYSFCATTRGDGGGMTHDEAREALGALALDALDASERIAVLGHVSRCAECQRELAALRATTVDLAYAVKPTDMPDASRARIRARLMARAAADRAPAVESAPKADFHLLVPHDHPSPQKTIKQVRWERLKRSKVAWVAMAASIVAILSLAGMAQAIHERDAISVALSAISANKSARGADADSLRDIIADRDQIIRNLTGPQVAIVSLAAAGVRAPSARMFWNQSVNAWTFVAHNLPAPKQGRTYQLWLVAANAQKISAGTFTPMENGDAVVRATYALAKDGLAAIAVTDEPSSGSPQPTTTPFLVGATR